MADEAALIRNIPLDQRLSIDALQRRRAMAQALMQRGFQQPNIPDHGRYTPFAALANILQSGLGAYQNSQIDKQESDISDNYRKQNEAMIRDAFGGEQSPSQPPQQAPQAPQSNSLTGANQNNLLAEMLKTPATAGDQTLIPQSPEPQTPPVPPAAQAQALLSAPEVLASKGIGREATPTPMPDIPEGAAPKEMTPEAPPAIPEAAIPGLARHDAIVQGGNMDDLTQALMNHPAAPPAPAASASSAIAPQVGNTIDNVTQSIMGDQGGGNVSSSLISALMQGQNDPTRNSSQGYAGQSGAGQPNMGQPSMQTPSGGSVTPVTQRQGIYANLAPTDKVTMMRMALQNPDQFQKMYGEGVNKTVTGPTDFARMLVEAGMPQDSPLFRQLMQTHVAMENYKPPTPLHKGAFAIDPMTGKMIFSPELPANTMPSDPSNPGGPVTAIPNAAELEARQKGMVADAEAGAKARYEGMPSVDPATGMKYTVPKTALQNNGGAPLLSEAPPGMMKEAEEMHGDLGKTVGAFQQEAEHSTAIKANIAQLRSLAKEFVPGALTPTKQRIGEIAQALGVPEEKVTSMFGSVGGMQAFNKTALNMTMEATKTLGSREAAQIVTMISKAFPSSNMTPEGLDKVFTMIDGLADYHIAKDQAAYKWRTGIDVDTGDKVSTPHGTMDGFAEFWNRKSPVINFIPGLKNLQENQSRIDMITKDAAANMPGKHINYKFQNEDGSTTQGSMPPATGGHARRYNPQTGKIE